jgi:hypothetical protein
MIALTAIGALILMPGCGSGSAPTHQPGETTTTVSSSAIKAASGTAITLTATVQSSTQATGTVTFFNGGAQLGSPVALSNGAAELQISSLGVGTNSITASYSGDSQNDPSTSQPLLQAITGTTNLQILATAGATSETLTVDLVLQ